MDKIDCQKTGSLEGSQKAVYLTKEIDKSELLWKNPAANDFETGWEIFSIGDRVKVKTKDSIWREGTIEETPKENLRAIIVKCDEKWHDDMDFHRGRGASVLVFGRTKNEILSQIRKINQ
ncbi:MAG TPA: hypothetical protein PLB52_01455 [Candidatus Moranbacteria bacterium]|nr:hypothetical protein [Candidatus Moranbacteria bacterium]